MSFIVISHESNIIKKISIRSLTPPSVTMKKSPGIMNNR